MSTALVEQQEWIWTPKKEKCLELILKGTSKLKIAEELDVHRNTINNWCSHPTFMAEVRLRLDEHRTGTALRRTREIGMLADISMKHAVKAAQKLDQTPDDPAVRRTFREFSQEYRDNMRHEADALGLNVRRVDARVIGDVQHTHHAGKSFKEAVIERVKKEVIDVEAIENSPHPMEAVQHLTRSMLVEDPSLLEMLHQQDRDAELAEKEK